MVHGHGPCLQEGGTPLHAAAAPESLIAGRPGAIDEPMSTMLVEIYDALKEAGASEEKARAAAASLTGRDDSGGTRSTSGSSGSSSGWTTSSAGSA